MARGSTRPGSQFLTIRRRGRDSSAVLSGGQREPARANRIQRNDARVGRTVLGVAYLLHLNGPPGIGKSTIARRYADEHPGVLNCDIDVLRTLIGGWSNDFAKAGSLIRPAALGMIEAFLASGHSVVLPQLLTDPAEVSLFESCAVRTNARFIERILMDSPERSVERFNLRAETDPATSWHSQVQAIVAAQGGEYALRDRHTALQALPEQRPNAMIIESSEGAVEDTFQRLLVSLAE